MPTSFIFNGKKITLPGVYSRVVSGVKNQPVELAYGKLAIIDVGSGTGWGGGSGVDGFYSSDKDSIYSFDNDVDFQAFLGGGLWYLLADPLFRPDGIGSQGVSNILYARAATTTAPTLNLTFNGDGSASVSTFLNGGTLALRSKNEGSSANGVLTNSILTRGFGITMEEGEVDTSKFVLRFYRGGFRGLDENGFPFDGIVEADSTPDALFDSIEFDNISTLITWMQDDYDFNQYFELTSSSVNGTGAVDQYDLADYQSAGYKLFSGGTTTYSSANLQKVLDALDGEDFSFIFADDYGTNAQSADNTTIANWAASHKYTPEVYIAAGSNKSQFAFSKTTTTFFDNENVTVVHGGSKRSINSGSGFRTYGSYYTAAALLGREAGYAPQIPLTKKSIKIEGLVHELNDKEAIQALEAGLLVVRKENGVFRCLKGVNSLQKNTNLLNNDGTSHSKQLVRIMRQLNKELVINATEDLLNEENGVNRNTLSEEDLKSYIHGYLRLKTATSEIDNLILSQRQIVVTRNQDAYNGTYEVEVNSEIGFIFLTGKIVDL